MVVYSIKDLENLSGVKAHTLRIWEKRYDLVQPKRTKTNIRFYTDDDLRKILNICFLYRKGYKISKIAGMCQDTIKEKVSNYSNLDLDFKDQLDALMLFILQLDSHNLNKVLDQHINQKGLEQTMDDLIYPLLDKLGFAWLAGSFLSVHESFVTQIIKSKIISSTSRLKEVSNAASNYMIFLPPQENQELSLLYFQYILKSSGCQVINLGIDVTLSDVIFAQTSCKPDFLFTIINEEASNLTLQQYVDQLCENLGDTKLLMTGYQTLSSSVKWPDSVILVPDLEKTLSFIQSQKN